MKFTFTQTDASRLQVKAFIDGVQQMLQPPNPDQAEKVADAIRAQYARAFAGEGPIQGVAWSQLAPSTVRDRISKGFGGAHPILVRTGSYRASFTQQGAAGHIDDFRETGGGWSITVGSRDFRAKFLNPGTARMPSRPVNEGTNRQAIGIYDAIARIYDAKWNRKKTT